MDMISLYFCTSSLPLVIFPLHLYFFRSFFFDLSTPFLSLTLPLVHHLYAFLPSFFRFRYRFPFSKKSIYLFHFFHLIKFFILAWNVDRIAPFLTLSFNFSFASILFSYFSLSSIFNLFFSTDYSFTLFLIVFFLPLNLPLFIYLFAYFPLHTYIIIHHPLS